jgi:hypothetical protein
MWSPTQRRLQNNRDYEAAFAKGQAKDYIDPITAANRANAAKMDKMLNSPAGKTGSATFTWNGKQMTRAELEAERQKINTKTMQEQYDEAGKSYEQTFKNPAEDSYEDYYKEREKELRDEIAKFYEGQNVDPTVIDADLQDQIAQRRNLWESSFNQNRDYNLAQWAQRRKQFLQDWTNNYLVPTYEGYVPDATERGADRNNLGGQ